MLSLVIVLSLALGIGSTTAIFSVLYNVLFRPLSYPHPEQLVRVWQSNPQKGYPYFSVSPPNFLDWETRNHVFQQIAAYDTSGFNLTSLGEPERITAARVTSKFFELMGVRPAAGRTFSKDETTPGKERVVLISDGFWRSHFANDPKVLGRTLRLDNNVYVIIGVMPASFQAPDPEADLWCPLAFSPDELASRGAKWLSVLGRMKAGIGLEQARNDMISISSELAKEYPEKNEGWTAALLPLQETLVGNVKKPIWVLFSAVVVVLLIACANIAGLLLARNATRQSEVAIRRALGASRQRLVVQFLIESTLYALIGGALGVLLAYWGMDALLFFLSDHLPRQTEVAINLPVLIFAGITALLIGTVFGILPAIQITSDSNSPEYQTIQSRRISRTNIRSSLIIGEVALALILLMNSGLLLRSLDSLLSVDPGFNAQGVIGFRIDPV